MKKIAVLLFILPVLVWHVQTAFAQSNPTTPQDTTHKSSHADTIVHSLVTPLASGGFTDALKGKFDAADPAKKANALKTAAKDKLDQFGNTLKQSLPSVKKAITYNLIFGDDNRYQPAPDAYNINPNQKFVSAFSVLGNVQLWGIPVKVNYTTNRTSASSLSGVNNGLFKFNFNPAQFTNMFKSDLQQYDELRKTSLGGLDLTGYTQKMLSQQLNAQQGLLKDVPQSGLLKQYLSNPNKVTELLTLSHDQIKQKLTAEVTANAAGLKGGLPLNSLAGAGLSGNSNPVTQKLNLQQGVIKDISAEGTLSQYLSGPTRISELKNLNESQITQKLAEHSKSAGKAKGPDSVYLFNAADDPHATVLARGILLQSREKARQQVLNDLSHKIFLNIRQNERAPLSSIIGQQGASVNQQLLSSLSTSSPSALLSTQLPKSGSPTTPPAMNKEIDSVATSITNLKEQLQSKGFDVNKMVQMQKYLNSGGAGGITEVENGFMSKKPTSSLQSLFTHIDGLKVGSFGDKVPGGFTSQDMFMTGTSITYKTGITPLTFGYGGVNDINSLKDADYQSSVYNSPRNITFLGADLKRGIFGHIKISVIGSINREITSSQYAIPTVSSNNVALTVSKALKIGNLGNLAVDISKSTTVYSNKYEPESEAILNKLGGLNTGLNNDLFEALAFGINHSAEVKSLNMSDNVYFNYSGTGYQNPGNNGYGGARMKFGGNVKKSFYKNKLTITLRSDMNNMPISYTSNDKWKSYQVQLDSRYVINKKFNVSFKYTDNGTDKKVDNVITPVYGMQKMQVDGNLSYKIGKNYSVSHLTVGKQDFTNGQQLSQPAGNMLMVNYTQSLVLNRNTVTASVFYNKELSSYMLIGDMLNSDIAYQYTLFGKVSMSSGITYLNNKGIASQAGVRQGIQLFAGTHFDLDSYLDLRKNMITPLYPELYSACRAEISLKYHIKN